MNSITPDTTPQAWNRTQQRTFIAAAFSIVVGLFSFATAPYILSAIGNELGFSLDNANILTIAPPAASPLAVFIAGTLGDVFGSKKVLLGGGVLYCIGVAIVLSSQSFALLLAGRALEGIGSMLLRVVSLALVAAAFTAPVQRTMAFSGFAAVSPITQILAPSIAAPLAGLTG
jgi:MFS family permease